MLRFGSTLIVACMLNCVVTTTSVAAEAANDRESGKSAPGVAKEQASAAEARAKMHRTMAALIEARATAEQDADKIAELTALLQTQQQQLRSPGPAPWAGTAGFGPCRGGYGMGYGAAWGDPRATGRRGGPAWGRGGGYGRGPGRQAGQGRGYGWYQTLLDQDGDGICDNYQKIREARP